MSSKTKTECQELVDKCRWKRVELDGVRGYKVTSKKNGASIFLPAAGLRFGSSLNYAGERGYYWSSTPSESDTQGAYRLSFDSGNHDVVWGYRFYGRSVRPVID
ncbi:MAG: hypothetical protein ACI3ZP_09170 [Candidatus Cryptobacteroides sp.]